MMQQRVDRLVGRISEQVVSCLNEMNDPTYLLDLIDYLEKIEDYNSIPDGWDKDLVTQYNPAMFARGMLSELGLWHAHFVFGSYAEMASTNLLKKDKQKQLKKYLVNSIKDINSETSVDEINSLSSEIANRWISSVTGIGGNQKGKITAGYYLVFKRIDGINYYLVTDKHLDRNDIGDSLAKMAIKAAKDIPKKLF